MQTLALLLCLSLVMPAAGAPSWEELALTRLASWLGSSGMPGAQLSVGGGRGWPCPPMAPWGCWPETCPATSW